jgi:hypothetical protein
MLRKMRWPPTRWAGRVYTGGRQCSQRWWAKDRSPPLRPYSPRYLAAVKGKGLNCLSSYWRANKSSLHPLLQLSWILTSSTGLQAPSKISCCFGWLLPMWWMLAGVSSDQPWCFLCSSYLNSQVLCGTFPSLGDGGTFDALALAPFVASGFPVSDLISVSSGCFTPCLWDHMVEDTTLGATIDASFHSYQGEVAGMWSSWPIHHYLLCPMFE